MTEEQAFRAMFLYLEERWSKDHSVELGQILGELQLDEDGRPFDLATSMNWHAAVESTMREKK